MRGLSRQIVALCLLLAAPAWAAAPADLPPGESGTVSAVVDADTVRLDGAAAGMAGDVRLVGIQAPKLPLGRANFQAWPLADTARDVLAALVQERRVTLHLPTTARDRNGRTLAHVVRDDGLWIQGEMLRQGFARVYSFPDNRLLAAEMLALERAARAARHGIWADEFYAVRDGADAPALEKDVGTFQIVAGTVVEAARVRDRVYLNFGPDYRSDFTASIGREALPLFAAVGLDPLTLQGRRIQVRGWLAFRNGPAIDLTHPEQVEVLDLGP